MKAKDMINRRHFLSAATTGTLAAPFLVRASPGKPVLLQRTLDAPPRCVDLGNGRWTGFEIEMSMTLCDRAGMTLQPLKEYLVWARALKMIEVGEVQLMAGISWREDRAEYMDFIGPYDVEEIYIIVRKENGGTRFETLDDFMVDDRVFENVSAAAIDPAFDKRLNTDPAFASHFIGTVSSGSLKRLGQLEALGNRVAMGRVFGAITDWYGYRALQKMKPADFPFDPSELTGIPARLFGTPKTYLAASKHLDREFLEKLRNAYRESRRDGSFDQIWKKWYNSRRIPSAECRPLLKDACS